MVDIFSVTKTILVLHLLESLSFTLIVLLGWRSLRMIKHHRALPRWRDSGFDSYSVETKLFLQRSKYGLQVDW